MRIDYKTNKDLPKIIYSSQRSDMRCYLPKDARIILDVGCSEGNFGELVRSRMNAEVWCYNC